MKNLIVIGIDQSYQDTGITISYNNKVMSSTNCFLKNAKSNTIKRLILQKKLRIIFEKMTKVAESKNAKIICIIERIRLMSDGFININYIKSIGALNAMITDTASEYFIPVYSVDTRAWKASIIGSTKPLNNKYGFDPKKWPTILWCIQEGYEKNIINYSVGKKRKGIIEEDGEKFTYNDNIADSIGISLFYFRGNKKLLEEEH